MSANAEPDHVACALAEEVLRTIYGDDFKDCTVRLETIAAVISDALKQRETHTRDMLGLYEKVVEALHLLSTPPDASNVTDPKELQLLLSERLDAIHVLTTKTIETTSLTKADPQGEDHPA